MSTNAAFKLQDAGFTRQQVEALGEFLDTQAATKADLRETETRLEAKIVTTVAEAKTDLLKAILAIVVTAATLNVALVLGAMFGLAKLLGH